jgi:hypothetical protein
VLNMTPLVAKSCRGATTHESTIMLWIRPFAAMRSGG